MNFFPSTMGGDVASSTTQFITTSGVLNLFYIIAGVLLALFIIEIVIDSIRGKRTDNTAERNNA